LTISWCPMQDTIHKDEAGSPEGLADASVHVRMTTMSPEQRAALKDKLSASRPRHPIGKDSSTTMSAAASAKGGVRNSPSTTNLAVGRAARRLSVGLIDADIHGFSIPGLLGITAKPTKVQDMIMPPIAHEVKVMSIGMFLEADQPVAWRGPMLHRALEQFVTE